MAVPVIASVDPQEIVVETDYMLDVSITGIDIDANAADKVVVSGLMAGFDYNWNQAQNQVEVRGQGESLFTEETFVIAATNSDGTTSRNVIWSVLPATPVIATIGTLRAFRGLPFSEEVEITGTPTQLKVEGPWVGTKFENSENGVLIVGDVPDREYTTDSEPVKVTAINGAGTVEETGTVEIQAGTFAGGFILIDSTEARQLFFIDDGEFEDIRGFTVPDGSHASFSNYTRMELDGDGNMYGWYQYISGASRRNRIGVFDVDIADGGTPALARDFAIAIPDYNAGAGTYFPEDFAYNPADDRIYFIDNESPIFPPPGREFILASYPANTGSGQTANDVVNFRIFGTSDTDRFSYGRIAFNADGHLFTVETGISLANQSSPKVVVSEKTNSDTSVATMLRRFTLNLSDFRLLDIAIDAGGNLYVLGELNVNQINPANTGTQHIWKFNAADLVAGANVSPAERYDLGARMDTNDYFNTTSLAIAR